MLGAGVLGSSRVDRSRADTVVQNFLAGLAHKRRTGRVHRLYLLGLTLLSKVFFVLFYLVMFLHVLIDSCSSCYMDCFLIYFNKEFGLCSGYLEEKKLSLKMQNIHFLFSFNYHAKGIPKNVCFYTR